MLSWCVAAWVGQHTSQCGSLADLEGLLPEEERLRDAQAAVMVLTTDSAPAAAVQQHGWPYTLQSDRKCT